eukprot:10818767-Alexandrium_andersonii.AAC.1
MAKECADCGLADCGLEFANSRFRDLGPPRARFRSRIRNLREKCRGSLGGQAGCSPDGPWADCGLHSGLPTL